MTDFDDDLMLLPGQGEPGKTEPVTSSQEAEQVAIRAGIPDYSQFRNAYTEDWTDLVEGDDFAENIASLVPQVVMLPRGDFQLPIVCSYLMLPSALCNMVPILMSFGSSGCGKSELSKLACLIHSTRPIGANSTPTSLRNAVMNARFGEPVEGKRYEFEKHAALAWEDVNPVELRKYEFAILNLLKLGVDRKSKISIAAKEGQNIDFEPFSPKYISSIHPLFSEFDFRELIRRLVVVQHKKYTDWTQDDYSLSYEQITPDDLIDLESYSWKGFSLEFNKFWTNPRNLEHWTSVQTYLSKKKGHGMERPLYKMSRDLIACGVVCGYWKNEIDAIEHMKAYWEWHKANVESQASALQQVLSRFIQDAVSHIEKANQTAIACGANHLVQPLEINPSELKTFVNQCLASGNVELGTSLREVNNAMQNLGWRLKMNQHGQSRWMKSTD